jgi:lipopolysaccharide export system permease protein
MYRQPRNQDARSTPGRLGGKSAAADRMSPLRQIAPRLLLVPVLAALGGAACLLLVPAESRIVEDYLVGFPDADAAAHRLRPLILGGLCFLPALAAAAYSLGGIFDRYLMRQFLGIFGICLSTLFLIWLLIDLSDNIGDFRETGNTGSTMVKFYLEMLPAVLVLLLALLYALGKLSANREIIAFIQSGRGIFRITWPLLVAGGFFTLFCLGLNYHWAPLAEAGKERVLDEARGIAPTEATQVIYRNPSYQRLWAIGAFPADYEKGAPLANVEVTTTDENHRIVSRLHASHARWDRENRLWIFRNASTARFSPGEPPVYMKADGELVIDGWPETPWQLIKPGLSPAHLGIPDLNGWLNINQLQPSSADPSPYLTQWHYRWSLPFTCLVTVLLATPLAIHFSRRGAGGGMFMAVVLSALMLLVTSIVLAFGESGLIMPFAAAWLPNTAFALLAAFLFHRRMSSRPLLRTLRKILPGSA